MFPLSLLFFRPQRTLFLLFLLLLTHHILSCVLLRLLFTSRLSSPTKYPPSSVCKATPYTLHRRLSCYFHSLSRVLLEPFYHSIIFFCSCFLLALYFYLHTLLRTFSRPIYGVSILRTAYRLFAQLCSSMPPDNLHIGSPSGRPKTPFGKHTQHKIKAKKLRLAWLPGPHGNIRKDGYRFGLRF